MPMCLLCGESHIYFLKSCMFLESQSKSYGKWVGNNRHGCQLRHQATLAHCQANCWTAAWHATKPCWPPCSRLPGWALPFALHRSGQVGRQEGTSRIVELRGAAVTTAGAKGLAHNPLPSPFLLTEHCEPRAGNTSNMLYTGSKRVCFILLRGCFLFSI